MKTSTIEPYYLSHPNIEMYNAVAIDKVTDPFNFGNIIRSCGYFVLIHLF